MINRKKVLLVKFGWSDRYDGAAVAGDFSYLSDDHGAERYTFSRYRGKFYGYIAPSGIVDTARDKDAANWTVFFIARKPTATGLHLVGWHEDACLTNDRSTLSRNEERITYSVVSESAYVIPQQFRTQPFSNERVKSLKFSFLVRSSKRQPDWRTDLANQIISQAYRQMEVGHARAL